MRLSFGKKYLLGRENVGSVKVPWIFGGSCALMAAVFYCAAAVFRLGQVVGQLMLNLSNSFIVAFIVMISFGVQARARARQESKFISELDWRDNERDNESAEGLLKSTLGLIMSKALGNEVSQILLSRFVGTQCEYAITFMADRDLPPGYILLRSDLSFKVVNLFDRHEDFMFEFCCVGGCGLGSLAWRGQRFYAKLAINGVYVDPDMLRYMNVEENCRVRYSLPLKPGESAEMFLRGEEPVCIDTGHFSYIQAVPVDALAVSVRNELRNQIQDVRVQMQHPARGITCAYPGDEKYVLQRAFLPGQGFNVSWRRTAPESAPQDSTR
jgi:hypothetical protein